MAASPPVSVAELVARHGRGRERDVPPAAHEPIIMTPFGRRPPTMVPDGPAVDPADNSDTGQLFVTELLRREGRDDEDAPARRMGTRARVLTAAAALVLASGVVTASAAALSGPRSDRAMPSSGAGADHIVGADVLRPDIINASVLRPATPADDAAGAPADSPQDAADPGNVAGGDSDRADEGASEGTNDGADDGSSGSAPSGQTPQAPGDTSPGAPAPQQPAPGGDTPPSNGGGGGGGGGLVGGILEPLDPILNTVTGTVTQFYATAPDDPAAAYDLLTPDMRGSSYRLFEQSWADVRDVRVDAIDEQGDGTASVTLTLLYDDGSLMHTTQSMRFSKDTNPLIADATLLSAVVG